MPSLPGTTCSPGHSENRLITAVGHSPDRLLPDPQAGVSGGSVTQQGRSGISCQQSASDSIAIRCTSHALSVTAPTYAARPRCQDLVIALPKRYLRAHHFWRGMGGAALRATMSRVPVGGRLGHGQTEALAASSGCATHMPRISKLQQ